MDACTLDVLDMKIGTDRPTPDAAHNFNGTLRLPPGTATVGNVTIGGIGVGTGLLTMSNTIFTVTNTITLNKTGEMTSYIDATPSGLDITNPGAGALSIDADATLTVSFRTPAERPHYGLAWPGDHVATLEAWRDPGDGRLVIDDAGLGGETAEIYEDAGVTYIGLPPPMGTMLQFM